MSGKTKKTITDEVRELIQEVAEITATKVCALKDSREINYYKAMESLLNNYTKLAQLVENEEQYMQVDLQKASKSIVKFSGGGGYGGTKTDEEVIDELKRQKAIQFQRTRIRFEEVDRVIRLFQSRKEFNVIRMYYFNEDTQGNQRGSEKRYTFEEIAEELEKLGLLKDERTARRWRSRIVNDMAVCMFGSGAAISASKNRKREAKT